MSCLCCGKATEESRSFCPDCLELAKAYPIPPGTAVSLPDPQSIGKRPRQSYQNRVFSAEEEVLRLRKAVRTLFLTVVVLCFVLGIIAFVLIYTLKVPLSGILSYAGFVSNIL